MCFSLKSFGFWKDLFCLRCEGRNLSFWDKFSACISPCPLLRALVWCVRYPFPLTCARYLVDDYDYDYLKELYLQFPCLHFLSFLYWYPNERKCNPFITLPFLLIYFLLAKHSVSVCPWMIYILLVYLWGFLLFSDYLSAPLVLKEQL